MVAYLAILATAIAALAGAPIYGMLPGAAVLFAVAFFERRKLAHRFAAVDATYLMSSVSWQSAGHAAIASTAAWGLGAISRLALM